MVAKKTDKKVSKSTPVEVVDKVKKDPSSSASEPVVEPKEEISYYSAPIASSLVVDDRVLPDSGLPTEFVEGILDIANEGSGLLRPTFHPSDRDIYISGSQIRRFNLRVGDLI